MGKRKQRGALDSNQGGDGGQRAEQEGRPDEAAGLSLDTPQQPGKAPSVSHSPTRAAPGPSASSGDADDAAVPEDLLCPLCHELLLDPISTACGHVFCRFCHSRVFEVHRAGDPAGAPPPARSRDCPMCRRSIALEEASPQEGLGRRVAAEHPSLHARRVEDVRRERERLAQRVVEYRKLYVGNLHQYRWGQGSNTHDWTFFVRMDTPQDEARFIDRVVVRLHPTFHPATLQLDRPPFQVRRLGWGVFVVTAIILFKEEWSQEPLVAHWLLDFEGQGSQREIDLELVRNNGGQGSGAGGDGGAGVPQQDAAGAAGAARALVAAPDWREAILAGLAAAGDDEDDESWQPQGQEEGESEEEAGEGAEGPGSEAGGGSEGGWRDSEDEEEGGSRPRTVGFAAGLSLCLMLTTLCTLCSPREFAGDYDISRYRTIYGSPRSSSSEEGPTYDDDENDDDDEEEWGGGGGSGSDE